MLRLLRIAAAYKLAVKLHIVFTAMCQNSLAGTNYTLEYCTDLRLRNWQPVATQPASGPSATQMDCAAGDGQRYYRVYYRP